MACYDYDSEDDLLDISETYVIERREFNSMKFFEKRKLASDPNVIVIDSKRSIIDGLGQNRCSYSYQREF